MSDKDSKTYAKRKLLVDLARSQVGAHYVNGAAGNVPDESNGAWYRPDTVKLSMNYPTTSGGPDKRNAPIFQAATCKVEGPWVCGGRCDLSRVKALPKGDMNAEVVLFDGFRWPRPDGMITSSNIVWGESCEGVRHFDCIGFINWCLGLVAKRENWSIKQFYKRRREAIEKGKPIIPVSAARAGDILLKGKGHIGIADGEGRVIHASGYKIGVIDTEVTNNYDDGGSTWTHLYRLSSYYWS